MIRRDLRQADGAPAWMLISQIEHARVSAELAARCAGRFGAASVSDEQSLAGAPASVRDEVLAAIKRHDDGWAEWERSPRLDPATGRPLTFTEIEPDEAVDIWSRSIAAAEKIGVLAAWMVAGHFLRLSRHADAARDAAVGAWQSQISARRQKWLAEWRDADSRYTPDLADAALQWLWTFDEVSLWLCCTPSAEDSLPCGDRPYVAGRGTPLEMELRPGPAPATAVVRPWRFAAESHEAVISGRVAPAAKYGNSTALLAATSPAELRWRIAGEEKLLETGPTPWS